MSEKPARYRKLFVLLGLPLALLIVVPVVILFGLSYYLRALVVAIVALVRYLLGYRPVLPLPEATQPPHFFDVPAAKKNNKP